METCLSHSFVEWQKMEFHHCWPPWKNYFGHTQEKFIIAPQKKSFRRRCLQAPHHNFKDKSMTTTAAARQFGSKSFYSCPDIPSSLSWHAAQLRYCWNGMFMNCRERSTSCCEVKVSCPSGGCGVVCRLITGSLGFDYSAFLWWVKVLYVFSAFSICPGISCCFFSIFLLHTHFSP